MISSLSLRENCSMGKVIGNVVGFDEVASRRLAYGRAHEVCFEWQLLLQHDRVPP